MSDRNATEKLRLSERFFQAAGDWLNKHPRADAAVAMTAMGMMIGYAIIRMPDRAVRKAWYMARPLDNFEPSHEGWNQQPLVPPYWQDLVFGDGRLEKLLARLEGQPHVNSNTQKFCLLHSGGGLRILPGHRDLVKYGMNDTQIIHAIHSVDSMVFQKTHYHGLEKDKTNTMMMTKDGIYASDDAKTPLIAQGEANQYAIMQLTDLIDAYRASGYEDDQAVAIADKTAQAIYTWLFEDVVPVIPNLFYAHYEGGYKATPQANGSLQLDRLPKNHDLKDPAYGAGNYLRSQSSENLKSLFEIMIEGYKGTPPIYPAKDSAPTPKAPF